MEINEEDNKQNVDNTDYIPSISVAMDQYFLPVTMPLQTAKVQPSIISSVRSTMRFKDVPYIQQGAVT